MGLRTRIATLLAALAAANLAAWGWALAAFHTHPLLLGTAFLAYGFGLRHAIDADHIAAIDNSTRKLMQDGQRPVGVGFFFSLGHSTVVIAASIAIAATATSFRSRLIALHVIGGIIGTLVSAGFLLAIAAMNLLVFIMAFPARFTAGMSLVDSAESLLMMGAYGWAFGTPLRKIYYNLVITLLSVLVAVLIGGIEALGLVQQHFDVHGAFWRTIDALNGQFGLIGFAVIATFVALWAGSAVLSRRMQSE